MLGAERHVLEALRQGKCLQVADAVSLEVQQQEMERCKQLVKAGSACRPVERMYAQMFVHGEGQEPADMAQHDLLNR